MESAVLNYLKFEMSAPTAKCFLMLAKMIASCHYNIYLMLAKMIASCHYNIYLIQYY